MLLLNYEFYDIYAVLLSFRNDPSNTFNKQIAKSIKSLLESPQIDNIIEPNIIRRSLAEIKNLDIDERQLAVNKAIIQSMTPAERRNPEIIKASRRQRIANGSGTSIQQVNQLLKQFEQSKEMFKQMRSGKFKKMF